MLTNAQFDRARRLALQLAGIELVERHRELFDRRRRRMGVLDEAGLEALLRGAEAEEPTASQRFVGLVTTNFSGFFRHPRHFEIAAEQASRAAHRRGRARLWSAAAATGEEAWSLAIALIEVFGREDPPVSLLATDIDAGALAVAERGDYGAPALQSVDPGRRARFFIPCPGKLCWGTVPALRRLVEFRPVNLAQAEWPVEGPFDVIFCRNVLMYLETRHRHAVLERMASLLAPAALLFLDPTEHLGKAGHLFATQARGVYSPRANTRINL